ncbi:MAG: gas vesicle protein GvpK, partial [Candidatus Omnitrophota bacterium]|nr:gas vesicle protein GvpK [Candidatus Omnitrophota bacterium]
MSKTIDTSTSLSVDGERSRTIETDSLEIFANEMEKVMDALPNKIEAIPDNAEKGLAKLVLTLIELFRILME